MSAVMLCALPCTAHAGDIKFAIAQDYPASTVTWTGSAGPGAAVHLYRDGHADRNIDMVLANTGGGPVVLYGLGGGRFPAQRTIISVPDTDASVVEVADINADGIPDILSGSYGDWRMTVLLGRPDGRFAVAGQYQLNGMPTQLAIADFNRDGHLDVAASAYAAATLTILLGNGDGSFRAGPPGPEANSSLVEKAVDFNGDRIPDLAVGEAAPRNAAGSNELRGELHILLGNGDGTFRPLASYPVGDSPEQIEYADINEDGNKDLVTDAVFVTNDISILYGLGGGRFAPEERMRVGGPGSSDVFDVHAAEFPEGVQLADFDGDGHLDMAVTQIVSSKAVLYEGDGRGNFTPAGSYDVAGFPEGFIAPADLDGNGCPDLAVPGNMPPVGPADVGVARVSVLLNLAAGCRHKPASLPTCSAATRGAPVAHAKLSGGWLTFRARRTGTARITWHFAGDRRAIRQSKHLTACRTYRLRAPAGANGVRIVAQR